MLVWNYTVLWFPIARSFDFEIKRMISDQIALHSGQLQLSIALYWNKSLKHADNQTAAKRDQIISTIELSLLANRRL